MPLALVTRRSRGPSEPGLPGTGCRRQPAVGDPELRRLAGLQLPAAADALADGVEERADAHVAGARPTPSRLWRAGSTTASALNSLGEGAEHVGRPPSCTLMSIARPAGSAARALIAVARPSEGHHHPRHLPSGVAVHSPPPWITIRVPRARRAGGSGPEPTIEVAPFRERTTISSPTIRWRLSGPRGGRRGRISSTAAISSRPATPRAGAAGGGPAAEAWRGPPHHARHRFRRGLQCLAQPRLVSPVQRFHRLPPDQSFVESPSKTLPGPVHAHLQSRDRDAQHLRPLGGPEIPHPHQQQGLAVLAGQPAQGRERAAEVAAGRRPLFGPGSRAGAVEQEVERLHQPALQASAGTPAGAPRRRRTPPGSPGAVPAPALDEGRQGVLGDLLGQGGVAGPSQGIAEELGGQLPHRGFELHDP